MQLGIVQTAYANGAAMAYAKALPGCQVVLTPTGVKHLHKAAERFDIGIYFEANGHGTVLFSQVLLQALRDELTVRPWLLVVVAADYVQVARSCKQHEVSCLQAPEGKDGVAVRQLLALARLSNQAVGDALSGLLMVEAALTLMNWDLPTWLHMYKELPSRQLKVRCTAGQ